MAMDAQRNAREVPLKANRRRHRSAALAALALAALAAGCAVEVQNTQPAKQLARQALPEGDVYIGWRVFQQKCASCHGTTATGGATGPDLLPRLREMGSHQFVGLVLRRYDWILAAAESSPQGTAPSSTADKVLQGRDAALVMPAWQGDPTVTAHITDLYAYLAARADGTQGPGRPAR
jgi:curli biogenesis system outer membrane secretion channel CsgG